MVSVNMVLRRALNAVALTLLSKQAVAQTYTNCNPLQGNTALGMSINVDFTQGAVNSFQESGSPTYDSNGVTFTVAKSGDAPQLTSIFYIMFGRVEFSMKAAPGAGIVSSFVLQSDDLDEIDCEWLGADDTEVQTNYFGKGITGSYNRGQFNPAANNQGEFIKYTVDWTSERIVWTVGGTVVRTLTYSDAEKGQYPQTPMQIKFGAWAGGDPSNPPGTIGWARGPTDYTQGPFSMTVKSLAITDYSTGSSYSYGDTSGSWESVVAQGGSVNGNLNGAGALTTTAVAAGATGSSPTVPAGGIASGTSTSSSDLPKGWRMTPEGKIVPSSSAVVLPTSLSSQVLSSSPFSPTPQTAGGLETVVSYDDKGFLTTMTVPTGFSTLPKSYDSQGFPVTATPTASDAFSASTNGIAAAPVLGEDSDTVKAAAESSASNLWDVSTLTAAATVLLLVATVMAL